MIKHSLIMLLILGLIISCSGSKTITVYTIGDSTMANKKAEVYPETGWGQVFQNYFDSGVKVANHAVNGRSSKSFLTEGRWKVVLDSLRRGDFVFIQFGHNDEKFDKPLLYTEPQTTFQQNLEKYVVETRKKGATPILMTPIVRRKFDVAGKLIDTHGKYPDAVRELASRLKVKLVDMQNLTFNFVEPMGDEPSKKIYLWTPSDQNFPEGRKDDTHLSVEGATAFAGIVAREVAKMKVSLAKHVKD